MRASRLLSVLLLLQDRGRLTAQQLSEELGVSVRTVYRDIEALGEAGVPVYAELGAGGGYQLVDGYRTRLTGLTPQEAGSIFLAGVPSAAAELGLGAVLATAELKLRASLPARLNRSVGEIKDRFHLDPAGWFRETETHPYLSALAHAVWERRRARMLYRRWRAPHEVTREISPLGIVLKAGVWYFVAQVGESIRTYRVSTVLSLEVLDETFERPADFDLAAAWSSWATDFEQNLHRYEARVRLAPAALTRIPYLMTRAMNRAVSSSLGPPDPDGWTTLTLPIESVKHAHAELLKLGGDVEVLDPPELRELMRASARAMVALYDPV
ncbi:WYL domain-containing protein [Actinoplanes sp. NPDC023714]|uniref:helix-turn-helix transcriptional regulator n=1 Tax=Actinoplanes sp. NPDC023714 TaxID=3154322 RepID=UPI0033FC85AA